MASPLPTANNGRDERGRFSRGNNAATGNPHARRVAELRSSLLAAVGPKDVEDVIAAIVAKAKGGDVIAAREVLDRTIGKAVASDVLQRLEALERALGVEL